MASRLYSEPDTHAVICPQDITQLNALGIHHMTHIGVFRLPESSIHIIFLNHPVNVHDRESLAEKGVTLQRQTQQVTILSFYTVFVAGKKKTHLLSMRCVGGFIPKRRLNGGGCTHRRRSVDPPIDVWLTFSLAGPAADL